MTYRLRWSLGKGRSVEASVGAALAHQNGTCENCTYVPDSSGGADVPGRPGWIGAGENKGMLPVGPIASVRYTHPLGEDHSVYVETALRQSTDIEPEGRNALGARMTPSIEGKLGGNGFIVEPLRYAWSGYARWYDNPALPDPEVYWNYT